MNKNILLAMALLLAVPVAHAGNKERSDEVCDGVAKVGLGIAIFTGACKGGYAVYNNFDGCLQSVIGRLGTAAVSTSDKNIACVASLAALGLSGCVGYWFVKSGVRNLDLFN